MNKIKSIFLIIVLFLPTILSGCSDKTELRDRAIVEAMAIDYEN